MDVELKKTSEEIKVAHKETLPVYKSLVAFIQPKRNMRYKYVKLCALDCGEQEQWNQHS